MSTLKSLNSPGGPSRLWLLPMQGVLAKCISPNFSRFQGLCTDGSSGDIIIIIRKVKLHKGLGWWCMTKVKWSCFRSISLFCISLCHPRLNLFCSSKPIFCLFPHQKWALNQPTIFHIDSNFLPPRADLFRLSLTFHFLLDQLLHHHNFPIDANSSLHLLFSW